jgi:hypothetical protein
MTTQSQEAAELRRWWRERDSIWGYVYCDPNGIWEDGDLGAFKIVNLIDCGQFFVLSSLGRTVLKLNKQEENHVKTKQFKDRFNTRSDN